MGRIWRQSESQIHWQSFEAELLVDTRWCLGGSDDSILLLNRLA